MRLLIIYQQINMVRALKNCVQLLLKFVNSVIGMAGIAIILYSLQMIRIWQLDADSSSLVGHSTKPSFPGFIHAFIGIGLTLCVTTCLGHFAAHTANEHCLSFYMAIVFLLLMLETSLIANVFVNSEWEKELPKDPLGRFDDFKEFVKSNSNVCQSIGILIIFAQGMSMFLATVLRSLATDYGINYYGEDRDYDQNRLPLLNPSFQPFYA